jgi:hypothetical protein
MTAIAERKSVVAIYRQGRIYQPWELTWPGWPQLKAFETCS